VAVKKVGGMVLFSHSCHKPDGFSFHGVMGSQCGYYSGGYDCIAVPEYG